MGEHTGMLYTVEHIIPHHGVIVSNSSFQDIDIELSRKISVAPAPKKSELESLRRELRKSKKTLKHND
jgi:hypothetical protein